MEIYITDTGQRVSVHEHDVCDSARTGSEHGCCIHGPSDHHMKDWPTNWRQDRQMMERLCPHGVGHPDPDDTAYKQRHYMGGRHPEHIDTAHGCDGCCLEPTDG